MLSLIKRGLFHFVAAVLLFSSAPANAQDDDDDPPTAVPLFCQKQCLNPCVEFGSQVFYRVTINNPDPTGTVNFTNVIVTDDQPVPGTVVASFDFLNSGQTIIFTNSYTPTDLCTNRFSDTITIRAGGPFGPITNSCRTDCPACGPCIKVTQVCNTNLVLLCNSNQTSINFSGSVSNCGAIALTNITLSDDLAGGMVLTLDSLAPGASASWNTNVVVSSSLCGQTNVANTVTAIGATTCNPAQTVTNAAICNFTVLCDAIPALSITKACASPIVTNVGSSLTVTGQVCNTGLINFTNVVIVDSQPGIPLSATNNIGSLAAGECKPYSFTYTATSCDPNHDVVTALGSSTCGNTSATASADCFLCCPGISIVELVACLLPGAVCPSSTSGYFTNATGIKGNTGDPLRDNPAFCYITIVRNTGHDPLTNIVIHDDKLGALGIFPGPLAVGGTITISNLRTNWADTTTNTVSVTAQCGGTHANGAAVSAQASTISTVVPATFECQKLVSVNGATAVQTSAPPCGVIATNITWYVTVTNTSQTMLSGIVVTELGTGPDLLPCGAVTLSLTNVLLPGEGTGLIPICSSGFTSCAETNINNSIRVQAVATGLSNVCAINLHGSNIVVETQCSSSLSLCCNHLTITKACASPIVTNVGSSLTVTGEVCNLGTLALTNVVIVDSQPGVPFSLTNIIDLLPPGSCQSYSFSYLATSCDPNHDVVSASGIDANGNPVGPVQAAADCFLCCPGISIVELVACLLPGAVCPSSTSGYFTNATGIKGNTGDPLRDNPAFCYITIVRNTGHDPLTNIVIHDDKLGALGIFPGPLAVGGTITISNLRTNWADTTTNTVSVTAQCGGTHANGAAVSAQASTISTVVPATFECQKLVSVNGATAVQTSAPPCGVIATNITWYVTVTNTSQTMLSGIVVTELGTGPDLLPCGAVTLSLTNVLLPGEGTGLIPICSSGFTSCAETNINNSIRVQAVATGLSNVCAINLHGSNIVVETQCSSSLSLCCNHLTITKACASPIVTNVGSSLTVTGEVCNLGTLALTNVVIVDSQPGVPFSLTNIIDLLPPGSCQSYSFSYLATSCDPNHDVVSASGIDANGNPVGPVQAAADCFLCCPGISIVELVACLLPGAVCPSSTSGYFTNATGIKGNTGDPLRDNPAFCYITIVRNTGHDPLTNIVIHDDKLGALGIFPGPLAVGGTITISNLRTNWADTTTNTVSVTAQCGGTHANGAAVSAQASTISTVVPATFECQKLVSVNGSLPTQTLAPHCNVIATNITWYVVVTNTGAAILHGITVTELGTGPDILPCGPVNLMLTNTLLPGESLGPIPICSSGFNICVETNIDNSILVQVQVAGISNECSVNLGGSNIVAESQCNASLALCCKPPVLGCRVTGGGRQDDPEMCPSDVRYVTHGGQVAGPLGDSGCVVTLNDINGNPCIRGRWTHVRQALRGLSGSFHARFYDTFSCACLTTNLDSTGLYSDGTCNPVDPMPGLQPPRTPGNKAVFTGVGDWSDPNGLREPRSVLFRVDIEDRSEPGGIHSRGRKLSADRYRIRIWVLTDTELAALNNPSNGLLAFRNAIAACNGLKYQDGVFSSQLPNNCGNQGTIVFPGGAPVRLPDIDDGGELKNGNQQLHPTVTACP